MCAWSSLNATFSTQLCINGHSAMISQSGAMVACILDWATKQGRGFSSLVSVGSMLDVAWGDLLEYYARDDNVRTILVYMETIGDARGFLDAARRVSLVKPIIALKVGRSQAAAKAAVSHTGSLAGSDDVVDAAFRRAGVIRADTISELF
jgi:acetyltransferase